MEIHNSIVGSLVVVGVVVFIGFIAILIYAKSRQSKNGLTDEEKAKNEHYKSGESSD